uniref:ANK_REP_REGION domain-containing protein n=1 Tax=Macrostomum lignano TaxID=282301 RepID=A0A1I8IJK2_9PLAT
RVTYVELSRNDRDNPLVIVQYFGDETAIAVPDPVTQRRISLPKSRNSRCTLRSSSHRRRVTTSEPTRLTAQISESRLIEASQCKVIVDHPHHQSMDIQDSNVASEVSVTSPSSSALDEDLREASAQGDEERVASLLAAGAGVNSVNRVNGWTALHWAAKRDHAHIVSLLLGSGANASIKSAAGKSPADVCTSPKLAKLLNSVGNSPSATKSSSSPADEDSAARSETAPAAARASTTGFVPNYLRNPEFHYARRTAGSASAAAAAASAAAASGGGTLPGSRQPLLLLARVAKSRDPDFIEVELANRSYDGLMDLLCQELGQDPVSVERIRKLPNVRLRNDADVGRLEHGQQLELPQPPLKRPRRGGSWQPELSLQPCDQQLLLAVRRCSRDVQNVLQGARLRVDRSCGVTDVANADLQLIGQVVSDAFKRWREAYAELLSQLRVVASMLACSAG